MGKSMDINQAKMWHTLANTTGNYYADASDTERTAMRDWLSGLLQEQKVTVAFEKADGTERIMTCTLSQDHGAIYTVTESQKQPRAPRPDVCVVWDCELQQWRSFRYDRLKRIEFSIG